MTNISVGSNLLNLSIYPCSGQTTNCTTGNIGTPQSQTLQIPGLTLTQTYGYDSLGRLRSASEGSGSWKLANHYSNGNYYVDPDPNQTTSSLIDSYTPTASTNFDSSNRLQINGASYDSNIGTQTGIGALTFTYDAENRVVTAKNSSAVPSYFGYVYDGEGNRVQKVSCPINGTSCDPSTANATITTYVYDASGYLAAEYGASPDPSPCPLTGTCYLSVDQLGSTRLVTDGNGNVVRRYDFLPMGGELWADGTVRTTAMGYQSGPDGFNPKFTGQMRDTESGLDYFHARYYSQQQGRFLSPDPENAGADPTNPQTWNGYGYVGGQPLALTDPGGESWFSTLAGVLAGLGTMDIGVGIEVAGIFSSFENVMNGKPPTLDLFGGIGSPALTGCGGPLGNCGTFGQGPWSEVSGLGDVQDPDRFIMDATPEKTGLAGLGATITKKACSSLPSGTVESISGNGNFVGLSGSLDLVTNLRTGEVTGFFSPGYFVGAMTMGGAVTSGYTFGDLGSGNSNYNGGFTGVSGGYGFFAAAVATSSGGPASPLSGIHPKAKGHVTTVSVGVQTPGRALGLNTTFSLPVRLGKFWTLADPTTAIMFVANQLCAAASY